MRKDLVKTIGILSTATVAFSPGMSLADRCSDQVSRALQVISTVEENIPASKNIGYKLDVTIPPVFTQEELECIAKGVGVAKGKEYIVKIFRQGDYSKLLLDRYKQPH